MIVNALIPVKDLAGTLYGRLGLILSREGGNDISEFVSHLGLGYPSSLPQLQMNADLATGLE